jgi:hypothetical protein
VGGDRGDAACRSGSSRSKSLSRRCRTPTTSWFFTSISNVSTDAGEVDREPRLAVDAGTVAEDPVSLSKSTGSTLPELDMGSLRLSLVWTATTPRPLHISWIERTKTEVICHLDDDVRRATTGIPDGIVHIWVFWEYITLLKLFKRRPDQVADLPNLHSCQAITIQLTHSSHTFPP